ncbi:hypothetical protein [Neptunomonas japonica]|uniref:hypothetical protein n=1 Tax=Neptunomonas japonica TaxID=417574 RepID=UPI001916686A|nr:hypothetical protein [Neptunomonas japonica]
MKFLKVYLRPASCLLIKSYARASVKSASGLLVLEEYLAVLCCFRLYGGWVVVCLGCSQHSQKWGVLFAAAAKARQIVAVLH